METKTKIITTRRELDQLIESCITTGYASIDYETNAKPLYNHDFKPTILSVSFQPGFACSIPLDHFQTLQYTEPGWDWLKCLKLFGREVIENPEVFKCGWNLKYDNQISELYHIYIRGTVFDGMLAKYLLDEQRPHDLKSMVRRYLPEYGNYEKQDAFDKIAWEDKELEPLCKYGGQDTDYTLRLCLFLEKKLIDLGMYGLFRNMIMTASRVLQSVEKNGLYMDRSFNTYLLDTYKPKIENARNTCLNLPRVRKFTQKYTNDKVDKYIESIKLELDQLDPNDPKDKRKITTRENKIAQLKAGVFTTKKEQELIRPLNLGSPTDLPALLFSKEGFNFTPVSMTDKGAPSTDEDSLKELRRSVKEGTPKAIFLDNLLELRGLEKMYKTYILGWNEKVQDDDCLHGRYNIHGTDSGRLSSKEPNLQQIPKTSVDANIKKQLVAKPNTLYLSSDFSQAELRIMAHLSGDETYLTAFRNGEDPHLAIAASKYGISYGEALAIHDNKDHPDNSLWKIRRKQAKQIAFGLIYGIGPGLLAEKLSDPQSGLIVTKEEAQKEQAMFFEQHPKIKKFKEKQERYLRKHGHLKSLFGRKRRLPEIYSHNHEEVAYAIRLGLNFPCQSAASDMTLFGSILIYWMMRQGKLPLMDEVATVHDAVYFNTTPDNINIWTLYKMWDIYRNPLTKPYFGFQINDVDMDMDFNVGRSMAEELPFVPGYDYNQMLSPDFNVDEYMKLAEQYRKISIKDYPKHFKKEMKAYEKDFEKSRS